VLVMIGLSGIIESYVK